MLSISCCLCGKAIVATGAASRTAGEALCLPCLEKCPDIPLGQRLLAFRLAANWSRTELARRAGISQNLVGYYERGRNFPSPTARVKLAEALAISYETLVGNAPLRNAL